MADQSVPARQFNTGIYEIVNTVNGKRYVGSAVTIRGRFSVHRSSLRKGEHHSRILQMAWNKYGEAAFVFNTLIICARDMLLTYEQIMLDAMRPEYNILRVAGSVLGHKWSPEAKAKITGRPGTMNGRTHAPESIAAMSAAMLGRASPTKGCTRPSQAVAATAAAHRGMKRSAETCAKIAAKAIGRKRSPESIAKGIATRRGAPLDFALSSQ